MNRNLKWTPPQKLASLFLTLPKEDELAIETCVKTKAIESSRNQLLA